MEDLISINYLDLFSIPELCRKNFFIPEYQRGYRWGDVQVRQLLEDLYGFIYDNKATGNFYCLQPIVVKEMDKEDIDNLDLKSDYDNNRWYEVIDGQQRLTTIRIILALSTLLDEDKDLDFTIYYKTRPGLGKMFNALSKERDEKSKQYSIVYNTTGKLDIDSWHILHAANYIINWFQSEQSLYKPSISSFKGSFYETFTNAKDKEKSVQVIWYELKDNSDAYEMFKRLNDKSISLNNAELIRGMFLSDSATYKCDSKVLEKFPDEVRPVVENREQARKQSHIIEEWDIIERQLRDESFWAFVKNKDSKEYSCRIEYIFDLISQKDSDQKDALYTYLEFDRMLKDGSVNDLWDLWIKVETYYSLLKAWYEDRFYYHKIGYLTTVLGTSTLIGLLSDSSTCSKQEFKKKINVKIKESITDKKAKEPRSIFDYTYTDDYNLLKRVLFLYNVESTYQHGIDRFPFDEYKKQKNWTLEHVHAQNSERIDHSDKEKWVSWFNENTKALDKLAIRLPDDRDLLELILYIKAEFDRLQKHKEQYSFTDMTMVFDRVLKYFDDLSEIEGRPTVVHGISNMALLSGSTNSSIGNSVFEVKRQMIMEADAKGEYIPYCTRKVFLKYYNKGEDDFTVQQNFYWSEKDRINYLNDIKVVMKEYFDAPKDIVEPIQETESING